MGRGGARPGAGRRKAQDPQKTVVPAPSGDDDAKTPAEAASPPCLNTEIKRASMPEIKHSRRGGARAGAGRPRRQADATTPEAAPTARPPQPSPPASDAILSRRVALCAGSGMDVPTIAAALLIEESRLRVEFAHELANGSAIVQADNLAALSAAAADGNAAAAKALLLIAMKTAGPPLGAPAIPAGDDVTARALRILQGGKQ